MQSVRTSPAACRDTGTATPDRLSAGQIARLVVLGVVLWLLAALFIRAATPAGWFGGAASVVVFALTVPGVLGFIPLSLRVGALRIDQVLAGVAIPSATALLCDGIAFTWVPSLYGPDAAALLPGAAWLFWAVGVSFVWALVFRPIR